MSQTLPMFLLFTHVFLNVLRLDGFEGSVCRVESAEEEPDKVVDWTSHGGEEDGEEAGGFISWEVF